jgi:signal-transduction protein with cAMP-binding, CBS, and nucleotidyltransferase domain
MEKTAGDILREKGGSMVTCTMQSTVREAVSIMTANRVGAILVLDQGRIAGIWTERDLLYRVLDPQFNVATERVSDHMTKQLISANVRDLVVQLYDKFLGRRIRHLLIEDKGEYVGILAVGDVMQATLQQRAAEYKNLKEMVSLEYYENWKVQHDGARR